MSNNKNYVIVKNAKDNSWQGHWRQDPKEGTYEIHSCHYSSMGKVLNILATYPTQESAQQDCQRLNACNSAGNYEVCPLIKDIQLTSNQLNFILKAMITSNQEWKELADSGDAGYWKAEDQDHYKDLAKAIAIIQKAI